MWGWVHVYFCFCFFQVKDVLFEPVRKTQDAMYFVKTPDDLLMPCGPKQPGAVQTTMQDLAAKGLASKVLLDAFAKTANGFLCWPPC